MRPVSGWLLLVGLFAVTGSPPFGMFISEFSIITGAVHEHHPWVAGTTVVMLAVIFVGIAGMIIDVLYRDASGTPDAENGAREAVGSVLGPAALAGLVLLFGLYLPGALQAVLARAAHSLGGVAP
jgi:hydrogenase-4 component F